MLFIKRTLPLIITFITGIIMIVAFFSGPALPSVKALEDTFPKWIQVIMSFTMLLGAFSLLRLNLNKISRKVEGWGYSLTLVIGFVTMAVLGFMSGSWPMFERNINVGDKYYLLADDSMSDRPVTVSASSIDEEGNLVVDVIADPVAGQAATEKLVERAPAYRLKSPFMAWINSFQQVLFQGVFKAAQATMFSLLAFFVASASFRAFRVKSKEAGLLMGAAFIVMLGNVPIGNLVSRLLYYIPIIGPSLDIALIKEWILAYPSSAAQSAILVGAMLGYISASMKIIFGVERSHLGGEG
ncbi:MAG: hypothetical protein A2W80_00850 [Candidatus Riflebacteria bacterium GWC2_50_8]|nr:MAG: hypothetical protein A2W80_00850 [Candidatus Riflebacteria bacterium GWC2_50_8]